MVYLLFGGAWIVMMSLMFVGVNHNVLNIDQKDYIRQNVIGYSNKSVRRKFWLVGIDRENPDQRKSFIWRAIRFVLITTLLGGLVFPAVYLLLQVL